MENRVSYIVVGIFVFVLGLLAMGFVLWLGKYANNEVYAYYKVITKESVSGLNPKAPVKLRGVIVGEVKDIYISRENSEDVVVLIQVKEGTPIKEDTYALISLQGITGLSYIELDGGSKNSPLLKTSKKKHGIIYTKSSMLKRVDETLSDIGKKTKQVLDKTQNVMSDKNLKNLEHILYNLANATKSLNKTLVMINNKEKKYDKILEGAYNAEKSAIEAFDKISKMAEIWSKSGDRTLAKMSNASDTTARVMMSLDNKLKDGSLDLDIIIRENLLPVQNNLEDLRTLMNEFQELIEELKNSPSDLIFKKSDIDLAPNEKRIK
jgi:phospholipid/cholesterol/gamma-HCH transport system substrate-binding protein